MRRARDSLDAGRAWWVGINLGNRLLGVLRVIAAHGV